jgi:polyphosphate kinase
MQEDGNYSPKIAKEGEEEFNVHKEFFNLNAVDIQKVKLIG